MSYLVLIITRNKAFTLAETLITLVIIGVVASLTVPALMNIINDMQYKVAYKKAFSDVSNAFNKAKSEGLLASPTGYADEANNIINFNVIKSEFDVTKECVNSDTAKCWNFSGEKFRFGDPQNGALAFIDSSGMAWSMRQIAGGGGDLSVFLVDTNGSKGPNQFGKDRFPFLLTNGTISADTPWESKYSLTTIGTPVKVEPFTDYTVQTGNGVCQTTPCYFSSWLKQ